MMLNCNIEDVSREQSGEIKSKIQRFGSESMESSNIIELPEEILLKIFSYLSTFDILRHVALVCKDFNRISNDSHVIKEISLVGCNSPVRANYDDLYDVIKRSQCLTKLSIIQRADVKDLITSTFNSSKKLKILVVNYEIMSEEIMDKIVKFGQTIEHLNLKGYGDCCAPNQILCQVPKLKKLKYLNLRNCQKFCSDDLALLARNCEHLETLHLELVRKNKF